MQQVEAGGDELPSHMPTSKDTQTHMPQSAVTRRHLVCPHPLSSASANKEAKNVVLLAPLPPTLLQEAPSMDAMAPCARQRMRVKSPPSPVP